jgi:hypothetical protein
MLVFYTVRHGPVLLGVRGNEAPVLQFNPVANFMKGDEMEEIPFFIQASWPPKLNPLRNVRMRGSGEVRRIVRHCLMEWMSRVWRGGIWLR